MSRRRRKGSNILGRILLISVAVHIVVVPILAKFGAFQEIAKHFVTATVTIAPPPPAPKENPAEKSPEKKQMARAKNAGHTGKAAQAKASAPHPPVVVASGGTGATSDNGPAIEANGTGKVGQVPTGPTGPSSNGNGAGGGGGEKVAQVPLPKVEPTPEPKQQPAAVSKPVEKVAATPHIAVFLAAEPSYQPQPVVPDDLRSEALDSTCVVAIDVAPDGTADTVKLDTSCGTPELDDIVVKAAKKWRFRPATRDGEPVGGKVRLHVRFKVEQ